MTGCKGRVPPSCRSLDALRSFLLTPHQQQSCSYPEPSYSCTCSFGWGLAETILNTPHVEKTPSVYRIGRTRYAVPYNDISFFFSQFSMSERALESRMRFVLRPPPPHVRFYLRRLDSLFACKLKDRSLRPLAVIQPSHSGVTRRPFPGQVRAA